MGQSGASAGLQTRRPGLAKECPVARPKFGSSVRDGSFAPQSWQAKEQGSPVCSTWDQRHLSGERRLPNRGVRERPMQCRLPRNSGRREPTVAITARDDPAKNTVSASLRVQAERLRLRRATARQSGISQLKLSEKQAKAIFISNDASHCVSCRRQRFPTVRTVAEIGNGEFRAKMNNFCPCASTVL
jgi:hypothetical protein